MIKPSLLIFLLSWLMAFNAHGYDPEIGHKPLTLLALQAYQSCFGESIDGQKRLLQGNLAMDHGTGSFSPEDEKIPGAITLFHLVTRTTNWHFYHPDKSAFSKQKNVEKSHQKLWQMAIEGVKSQTRNHNKQLFLGALLHLTEDLSVPAHVVPVYHGPTTALNWFGEFEHLTQYMTDKGAVDGFWLLQKISDNIDIMPPNQTKLLTAIKHPGKGFCQGLIPTQTPDQIRLHLAGKTLALINTAIPACNGVKWSRFWPAANSEDRYFGRYNVEAGFPLFGEAGVISDKHGQVGCTVKRDDQRYLDFIFQLHLEAIKADVRLMRWSEGV
ncbi:MAG: hypothetical protein ACI8WB_005324 [Phenylobacterium sp.]|jgi:hypothetical protein